MLLLRVFFMYQLAKNKDKLYKRDIMQLFSADPSSIYNWGADDKMFSKKKFKQFLAHENRPQKLLMIGPPFFIQYYQPGLNQPKSQFLFNKNGSLCNFYIMTLCGAFICIKNWKGTMSWNWALFIYISPKHMHIL